ncbi:MAG: G-D-S-L family lipolytic protein [Acidobacteria bacterium]|nr:G-D-S-L family lipolytic protein [Acidobacteriota bacterium]MYJ04013.1 G-D-S-L family lipolytic protein [Acidobacteriota bacterium]
MKTRYARIAVLLVLALGFTTLAAAQTQTIDPTRFEEAIQAFEAEDRAMMPPEGAIVVTGSSSIRRWHPSLKQDLAPLTVIPRGFGGSTMQDLEYFLDRIVLKYKPRAVVIYEGDNDTAYGVAPEEIVGRLESIVDRIHAEVPEARVYVMSVKPSLARVDVWDKAQEANALSQRFADSHDLVSYIDVANPFLQSNGQVMDDIFIDDGLHLNEKGTEIWASTIKAALMKDEAQHEPTEE